MLNKMRNKMLWVPAIALALTPATLGAADVDAAKAEELFVTTHKCNMCHSVEGAGIAAKSEKMGGGDLTGHTTEDLAKLGRFLRREEPREDSVEHKKTVKATDEELQTVVDWLGSLEPAS